MVSIADYAVCLAFVQEGQLSYEEAIIAKQAYIQDTRDKVSTMKEEVSAVWHKPCREREGERKSHLMAENNEEGICYRRGR